MAELDFENVTKVFDDSSGTVVAVEELDLHIDDGEFVVFVGPSGCGKSTTLRMLAGLETVTDGEIKIGDRVVNNVAPKNRGIAMVFQNYALYPHKSVRENMAYGLRLSTDLSDDEIMRRVEEAAEMMGIKDLLEKKPGALSGGQQQRVATGRAMVREPELFLFDEPLSNLDAKLRKHMRTELARLHTELGITTIYVTHDQEEAMTLAERIVVLENGRLQQIGTPKEVYYHPANLFVADFIGSPSMNLFEAELNVDGDTGTLTQDDFTYDISAQVVEAIDGDADGTTFVLGVRPEAIEVDETADPATSFEARVDVVEVIGSENFLYLDIGGEEMRVRVPSTVEPDIDEIVRVTFAETDIHLFDKRTGEAVVHGHEKAIEKPAVTPEPRA